MPRLSLGLGAQNIRKVGGAAPSGIPTATTNTINISSTEIGFNNTFNKNTPSSWYDVSFDDEFRFYNSRWEVGYQSSVYLFNTLPNQTEDYIPLTGWSPADTTVTVVA
jgi:hypothetical protein